MNISILNWWVLWWIADRVPWLHSHRWKHNDTNVWRFTPGIVTLVNAISMFSWLFIFTYIIFCEFGGCCRNGVYATARADIQIWSMDNGSQWFQYISFTILFPIGLVKLPFFDALSETCFGFHVCLHSIMERRDSTLERERPWWWKYWPYVNLSWVHSNIRDNNFVANI